VLKNKNLINFIFKQKLLKNQ